MKEIVEIHHIGSTAVPNLKAKPTIDMMPIVKDIEIVDAFNTKMIEIGYEFVKNLKQRAIEWRSKDKKFSRTNN